MTAPRRCAIYTRKSTNEGLDQDFNSLDAQREACEAFVKSQAAEGWGLIPTRYDDGGYSGGSMERPALQALLDDVKASRIDVVVVYKIDRLTRSLTDFARIIDVFEAQSASFVSVTQAFNTTTSMGRLTLNVLLSFAQFEREVTAERIRDKIAASKKKGMWMGGLPPLGYDVRNKQLIVNEAEADTVRTLFRCYVELGNVRVLRDHAQRLDLVTKIRRSASGRTSGGAAFSRGHLYRLLSNPIYLGEIQHRGVTYPGLHEAIIDKDLWQVVQDRLAVNGKGRHRSKNVPETSLLAGLVFDETGDRLSPSHATKNGMRYRYYISHRLMRETRRNGEGWRLPARELERIVVETIAAFLEDQSRLINELKLTDLHPGVLNDLFAKASSIAANVKSGLPAQQRSVLCRLIERIELGTGELRIWLEQTGLMSSLGFGANASVQVDNSARLDLTTPLSLRRRGVEAKLVIEVAGDPRKYQVIDEKLIGLIVKAHRWLADISSGTDVTINQIAEHNGLDASDVTRVIPLAFLAPDIVEAIIRGRQPVGLTADRLKKMCPLPPRWADQRSVLGFPAGMTG